MKSPHLSPYLLATILTSLLICSCIGTRPSTFNSQQALEKYIVDNCRGGGIAGWYAKDAQERQIKAGKWLYVAVGGGVMVGQIVQDQTEETTNAKTLHTPSAMGSNVRLLASIQCSANVLSLLVHPINATAHHLTVLATYQYDNLPHLQIQMYVFNGKHFKAVRKIDVSGEEGYLMKAPEGTDKSYFYMISSNWCTAQYRPFVVQDAHVWKMGHLVTAVYPGEEGSRKAWLVISKIDITLNNDQSNSQQTAHPPPQTIVISTKTDGSIVRGPTGFYITTQNSYQANGTIMIKKIDLKDDGSVAAGPGVIVKGRMSLVQVNEYNGIAVLVSNQTANTQKSDTNNRLSCIRATVLRANDLSFIQQSQCLSSVPIFSALWSKNVLYMTNIDNKLLTASLPSSSSVGTKVQIPSFTIQAIGKYPTLIRSPDESKLWLFGLADSHPSIMLYSITPFPKSKDNDQHVPLRLLASYTDQKSPSMFSEVRQSYYVGNQFVLAPMSSYEKKNWGLFNGVVLFEVGKSSQGVSILRSGQINKAEQIFKNKNEKMKQDIKQSISRKSKDHPVDQKSPYTQPQSIQGAKAVLSSSSFHQSFIQMITPLTANRFIIKSQCHIWVVETKGGANHHLETVGNGFGLGCDLDPGVKRHKPTGYDHKKKQDNVGPKGEL